MMADTVYSRFHFQVLCVLVLFLEQCLVWGCPPSSENVTLSCAPPYKECCHNEQISCCLPPTKRFFQINKTLATVIAVSVTTASVILTALIIICCFWSRCPLYTACRVRYTHDSTTCSDHLALSGTNAVEKRNDLNQMPAESGGKSPKRLVLTKNCSNGTPGPPHAVADV